MSYLLRIPTWLQHPETASGALTVAAMVAAFAMVTSPLKPLYELIHHTPLAVRVGAPLVEKPLILWVNEGLMVFFFLLVALQIKREVLEGHLASPARIALPAFAALGGILALAIFNDLGAIGILAELFTESLSLPSLLVAAGALLVLAGLNRFAVTRTSAYVAAGIALSLAVLESGVHSTLAGFLIGLAIPLRTDGRRPSPLHAAELGLRPWVALGIVPVFAFFNTGVRVVDMPPAELSTAIAMGTALALVIGKPLGILSASWLSVRLGLTQLPHGVRWLHLTSVSILAGIGFTMSLFFSGLAFGTNDALALSAKIGILAGAVVSAALGIAFLAGVAMRRTEPHGREDETI